MGVVWMKAPGLIKTANLGSLAIFFFVDPSLRVRYKFKRAKNLNEFNTRIFVTAEFDFDNHLGIGLKLGLSKGYSKFKICQILAIRVMRISSFEPKLSPKRWC